MQKDKDANSDHLQKKSALSTLSKILQFSNGLKASTFLIFKIH